MAILKTNNFCDLIMEECIDWIRCVFIYIYKNVFICIAHVIKHIFNFLCSLANK